MTQPSGPQVPEVLSYLQMRKAVGIIGCALPFALAIGKYLLQGPGIENSVSHYYYTDMRNVLVGSLCAIGIFLISTKGYDYRDVVAGILAGGFAIGVALFPTSPCENATTIEKCIGLVHLSCAALHFGMLAYMSLFLFTETDRTKSPTPKKLQRNVVYRVCGWIIVACIVVIAVGKLALIGSPVKCPNFVFWAESLAIVSFGVSWLVKGEAILKDQ